MKSRINLQTNKYENKQRKKTLLNVCLSIFFSRDKLSGLLQTCTIGLINGVWLEGLFEKSSVEIGPCFLVVSLEMLDKSNQTNNNRIKSDEDCRSSSRNVCHFYWQHFFLELPSPDQYTYLSKNPSSG